MNAAKRKRLQDAGIELMSFDEYLGLTPEEAQLIKIKVALGRKLRQRRSERMTQDELAHKIRSSQSRIAKAEAGDQSVSVDLLVRAMLATGASTREIAQAIDA